MHKRIQGGIQTNKVLHMYAIRTPIRNHLNLFGHEFWTSEAFLLPSPTCFEWSELPFLSNTNICPSSPFITETEQPG